MTAVKFFVDTPSGGDYMRDMDRPELTAILEKHRLWRSGDPAGERADLAGASLSRANLARADLSEADLARADLSRADLSEANLTGANLSHADLSEAYLSEAYLSGANLSGANLTGANLTGANLSGALNVPAGIEKADPPEPYQRVRDAEGLARHAERYRAIHPDVPVVPDLDQQILRAVDSGEGRLEMDRWHSCATTHCRAGWAVHLAGKDGYALEASVGPERAGHMIYMASTGRSAHFFATNAAAMADIRLRAAESGPRG